MVWIRPEGVGLRVSFVVSQASVNTARKEHSLVAGAKAVSVRDSGPRRRVHDGFVLPRFLDQRRNLRVQMSRLPEGAVFAEPRLELRAPVTCPLTSSLVSSTGVHYPSPGTHMPQDTLGWWRARRRHAPLHIAAIACDAIGKNFFTIKKVAHPVHGKN